MENSIFAQQRKSDIEALQVAKNGKKFKQFFCENATPSKKTETPNILVENFIYNIANKARGRDSVQVNCTTAVNAGPKSRL